MTEIKIKGFKFWTTPEFAKLHNLTRQRIWVLVKEKRIPAVRIGNSWLITENIILPLNRKKNENGQD